MGVLTAIRREYDYLSKANKKIADYILQYPDKIIKQTSMEIGKEADVSSSSVVRFVKKIGYSGLDEMKVELATNQAILKQEREIDPIVSANDSLSTLCEKVEKLIKETAEDVFMSVNQESLANAIFSIQKAENIYLFGIGASSLVAYDLFHKFNRVGKRASFVFDIHIGLEMLNYATPNDVVIAITYSGHTKEILLACEYARLKKVQIILITRNDSSKLKEIATELLRVPGNEHLLRIGAISSLYSSMIVGTVLYLGVIQEDVENDVEKNMIITKNWIKPFKEE